MSDLLLLLPGGRDVVGRRAAAGGGPCGRGVYRGGVEEGGS